MKRLLSLPFTVLCLIASHAWADIVKKEKPLCPSDYGIMYNGTFNNTKEIAINIRFYGKDYQKSHEFSLQNVLKKENLSNLILQIYQDRVNSDKYLIPEGHKTNCRGRTDQKVFLSLRNKQEGYSFYKNLKDEDVLSVSIKVGIKEIKGHKFLLIDAIHLNPKLTSQQIYFSDPYPLILNLNDIDHGQLEALIKKYFKFID